MPVFYLCSVLYLWVCVCSGIGLSSPIDSLRSTHVFREVPPNLSERKDLARGNRMNLDYINKIGIVIWQRDMGQLINLLHEALNQRSVSYGQHFIESEKSIVALTHQRNGHTSQGREVAPQLHGISYALPLHESTIQPPSSPVRSPLPVTQRKGSSLTSLPVKDAELIALNIKKFSTVSLTSERISPSQTHVCSRSSLMKGALNTELITVTAASSDEPVVVSAPGTEPSVSSSVAPTRRIIAPSVAVTLAPSAVPSSSPIAIAMTGPPKPSSNPIAIAVTGAPSAVPSSSPIAIAVTRAPSAVPTSSPIAIAVTGAPSAVPSSSPIAIAVTGAPSALPSSSPIAIAVTRAPSAVPSSSPIAIAVTGAPSAVLSSSPIAIAVTGTPSAVLSSSPIAIPMTGAPSALPSSSPIAIAVTGAPSAVPSSSPIAIAMTRAPSAVPTSSPIAIAVTGAPSAVPSSSPIAIAVTGAPSALPSSSPIAPSARPTVSPIAVAMTGVPSALPSSSPIAIAVTGAPSAVQSSSPTALRAKPAVSPIAVGLMRSPSALPSVSPTAVAASPISRTLFPSTAPRSAPLPLSVTPSLSPELSQTPSVFVLSQPTSFPTTSDSTDEQDQPQTPRTYRSVTARPISYPTMSPNCATATTLQATQALSGTLPSNLGKNTTFLLSVKKTLSAVLTLLPIEVSKVDISNGTSKSEVQLSYKIDIDGCNAASNLITRLRTVMGSGYFIEILRNYTGIPELYISEPIITVNATIGLPKRAGVTGSESGIPIGISAGVVGAIIGGVLIFCLLLAFCYYGVLCRRMGNDSYRMQTVGSESRASFL